MGTRINLRIPLTKVYIPAYKTIHTPEDECNFSFEYDASGLTDLASVDLVFLAWADAWIYESYEGNRYYITPVRGRLQFLDSSKAIISEINFAFSETSTATYDVPSGTAHIKLIIDKLATARFRGSNGDIPETDLDSVHSPNSGKPDFLKLQLKDSGGNLLDEVALRAYATLCPPVRGDNTYSVSGINPQLEIPYSLVNTLQYCRYVGFAIDEVLGTPADTDKLYFELYSNDTKRDSTYILGQDIKAGTVIKLPQSPSENSDANKMVIRVESSGRYFQVRGHIVWFYDPVIGIETY